MRETLAIFPRAAAGFVLAAALMWAGCQSPGTGRESAIIQLNLITVPVAVDFDGRPGPDGISIRVYASAKDTPKQVAIRHGTLEVIMFDGTFQRQGPPPTVLKKIQFTAEELRRFEFSAEIGKGYLLSLPWGTNIPTHRVMSVAARYTPPEGPSAVSRPSSVTVLAK